MPEKPMPPHGRETGTLTEPEAAERRGVMQRWRRHESGMDGPRGMLPEQPDDAIAYKLLDAAGDAIGRGELRKGLNILRLVVKDYRHSAEAACARQAIDRLAGQEQGRTLE